MSPALRPADASALPTERGQSRSSLRHAAQRGACLLLAAAIGCAPVAPREVVIPAAPPLTEPAAGPPPIEKVVSPPVDPSETPSIASTHDLTAPIPHRPETIDLDDEAGDDVGVLGGVMGGVAGAVVGGVAGGVMGGAASGAVYGGTVAGPPSPSPPPPYATAPRVTGTPSCSFPKEADDEGIDQAKVVLRVTVETTGKPSSVLVLSDPGHGFGRVARACALKYTFQPGKDASGAAVKSIATLIIRFDR